MSLSEIIMAEHSRSQGNMIADIIIREPVLLDELILIIHQILPYTSAGVKSKSLKTLRKIEKLE